MKRYLVGLLATILCAFPALAQSKRGTWEGFANSQQGAQRLIIVLDSAASGWRGAAVAPSAGADSIRLVDIRVRADTLSFGIPYNGNTVYIEGVIAANKFSGGMWYGNTSAGSVVLTRNAEADKKPH